MGGRGTVIQSHGGDVGMAVCFIIQSHDQVITGNQLNCALIFTRPLAGYGHVCWQQ